MSLCPQCYCPEHHGMSCIWCGCLHIEEKKEMTNDEAIKILLKYVETDTADESLQAAVQVLKQEKNNQKKFRVAVQQTTTLHYEVLHNSLEEAVDEVQKKVNERDWGTLLTFPPGSPNHTPIPPFTDYEIKDVFVKEQVLRPNPQSEGGSSDT
jgi:hypothetical protein